MTYVTSSTKIKWPASYFSTRPNNDDGGFETKSCLLVGKQWTLLYTTGLNYNYIQFILNIYIQSRSIYIFLNCAFFFFLSGTPRLNCYCAQGCAACTFTASGDTAGTPAAEHCTACMTGFSAKLDGNVNICILEDDDDISGGDGGDDTEGGGDTAGHDAAESDDSKPNTTPNQSGDNDGTTSATPEPTETTTVTTTTTRRLAAGMTSV